jgi:3-oxoacyl-[acyl-carrier-protein] synthase III
MIKDIFIKGCNYYVSFNKMTIEEAIANNLYDEENAMVSGYESISVENNMYPADMALITSQQAIKQTQIDNIRYVIYSSIHRHGHNLLWSPASFLQNQLGLSYNTMAFCVNQGCNGQMMSIEIAATMLQNQKPNDEALVTSSDNFNNSSFNRWKSDYGIVYGDASTSVILSKKDGFAKIKKILTITAPNLEGMHRMDNPHVEEEGRADHYNIRSSKKRFLDIYGNNELGSTTKESLQLIYDDLIDGIRINKANIKYFIFPNVGKKLLINNYYPVFNCNDSDTLWDFGKRVGHLGSGDCIAGLSFLKEKGKLKQGDLIIMIGAGAGFSWTGCLLEIC